MPRPLPSGLADSVMRWASWAMIVSRTLDVGAEEEVLAAS
jgi:hypothetical protein